MEKLDLFRAIGEMDDDILEDAEAFLHTPAERLAPAKRPAPAWVKWGGLAACAALLVCVVWFAAHPTGQPAVERASEALLPSAAPTQEVTTGAANVDRPAVEPRPEELTRPAVELRFNELIEAPQESVISLFALMSEDFVPMTWEELLDYYGVTLPVEELFPLLSNLEPEGTGSDWGIYRREGGDIYWDGNTFSFTSADGVLGVSIALDKAFHLPSSPWELPGDELRFTSVNGWELALFRYPDEAGDQIFCTEFRQNGVNYRVTGKNLAEGEFAALLEALLEPRADFAPGEIRTVTGKVTVGISKQTLTAAQLDGSSTSTDTFVTYRGPLGLLTVDGGSGYPSLSIELTPEQAAQLQFAGLALGDQVTVRFTGEPATIGTVWNQQLVSIEAA